MKLVIERPVTVITPTLGDKCLSTAMESVENQTYGNITHLVVGDGPETFEKIMGSATMTHDKAKAHITFAPYNTGAGGFYGHRIYAAYPHLVDSDYVLFLDDDNWYEPDHVATMVEKIESMNLNFSYSLRKVWLDETEGGTFLADDCCESIGEWPIWFTSEDKRPAHLIDTSAYCFRRDFLIKVCQFWHSGWGGDRRFYEATKATYPDLRHATTGQHTLNYRLPPMAKAYGGQMDFFEKGNAFIRQKYGDYPWL